MKLVKRRLGRLVLVLGLFSTVVGESYATHGQVAEGRELAFSPDSSPLRAGSRAALIAGERRNDEKELENPTRIPPPANAPRSTESCSSAGLAITPAPDPELVRRQLTNPVNPFNPVDVLSASLNSAKAANAAATASIKQLQQSIGDLQVKISQVQVTVSLLQGSAQAAQSSANGGAVTANASVASAISSIQASASSAIAAAITSVQASAQASALAAVAAVQDSAMKSVNLIRDSASKSISEAMAMATSASRAAAAAMADASNARAEADSRVKSAQGAAVSVTQAAIAVVAAIIGTSLLSLLGFWLITRYRRAKRYEKEEAERYGNAALNRAVMSYIVKGDMPSPTGPHPAVAYAVSDYRGSSRDSRSTSSRPTTAEKSAIPGMGFFQLFPPRKSIGGQPLNSNPLETVREVGSTDSISETSDDDTISKAKSKERRYSNWPFGKEPKP